MNKKAKKEQSNTASGPERSKLSNSKMSRLDEQKSKERNGNGEEASEEEEMGVPWSLYAAHTLSTWGDNMWWFAGGCYMLELLPSSLRLTAIYGLVIAASVIVFGASVGRLVDTMGRISAARLSLEIQNLATAACALTLAAFLHYRAELDPDGPDHPSLIVSVFAITLAAVARLASCGTNIIIQKDWIVVIAGGDNDKLATMNSILRTIELTTYAIAPAVAGCLFTLLGFGLTGLVIAAWNVVSVCLEYCLLSRIHRRHPCQACRARTGLPVHDRSWLRQYHLWLLPPARGASCSSWNPCRGFCCGRCCRQPCLSAYSKEGGTGKNWTAGNVPACLLLLSSTGLHIPARKSNGPKCLLQV